MKIICIGQNYRAHIAELRHEVPAQPVFFFKPDTALLVRNRPFYLPEFSQEIHYETEVILRIGKVGKYIPEKYAEDFFDAVSLGFDFTARDLQRRCVEKGLPWEISKSFDQSAAIGRWIPKTELPPASNLHFHLNLNGNKVQDGFTGDMLFGVPRLISYVSQFMTLHMGDILFTGTPVGVGPVHIGDRLEAVLEGQDVLRCEIK